MRDEDSNRYPIMVLIKTIRKDPKELIFSTIHRFFRYTLSIAPSLEKF